MPKTVKHAHVHRFRDLVAVSIGSGHTVYLTPAEAHEFGRKVREAATDIKARPFGQSTFKSHDMPLPPECGHSSRPYQHVRREGQPPGPRTRGRANEQA